MANVLDFSMRDCTSIMAKLKFKALLVFIFVYPLLFSCSSSVEMDKTAPIEQKETVENEEKATGITEDSIKELKNGDNLLISSNLVDIQTIDPSIKVELRYATSNNFMGIVLYEHTTKLFLQNEVAERLSLCQKELKKINSTYSLLVYDGARPVSVQQKMWDALDSIPVSQRTKFVSNPANGSVHNYGAAVDITICDQNGVPLDMGAGYDDIREIAYPRFETRFLASGELNKKHIENRELLRKVMRAGNFKNIATEWWHFNAFTRLECQKRFEIIK